MLQLIEPNRFNSIVLSYNQQFFRNQNKCLFLQLNGDEKDIQSLKIYYCARFHASLTIQSEVAQHMCSPRLILFSDQQVSAIPAT